MYSFTLSVTLAYFTIISAHENGAFPKILGLRPYIIQKNYENVRDMTQKETGGPWIDAVGSGNRRMSGRDNSGKCGPGYGSCQRDLCCSSAGWCGTGKEYCSSPDCLIDYGPGCDSNQRPFGDDTSDIARPHVGNILYGGTGIFSCRNRGEIAITFDDGPYKYTEDLLDTLAAYGAKATFFITGNNLGKGMINDPSKPWGEYIRRMIRDGHQVASHTWSHQNASQLTDEQFTRQIIWNEIALYDILGFIPTYMRPPYSICEKTCQDILSKLGYHMVYYDLDTEGYLHDDASLIQASKDIWQNTMDRSSPNRNSYLEIEHDIDYQTVYNLTDYILLSLFEEGYRSVTVGQCLGDPPANWYRRRDQTPATTPKPQSGPCGEPTKTTGGKSDMPSTTIRKSDGSSTTPVIIQPPAQTGMPDPSDTGCPASDKPGKSAALRISQDGSCGTGVTCQGSRFGDCCSQSGYCGWTLLYCGQGCQVDFGVCSIGSVPTTTPDTAIPKETNKTISRDGSCGNGKTCLGSPFGDCCSSYGWCGNTPVYCKDGCESAWGECW